MVVLRNSWLKLKNRRILKGLLFKAGYEIANDGYYPLFLMTDGTLKMYVNYEGEYTDPVDSENKLIEIEPEGDSGEKYIVDRYTNWYVEGNG